MVSLHALWVSLILLIPSNMIALFVGMTMQGRTIAFRRLAAAGALLGAALGILRAVAFGLHTALSALSLVLAVQYLSRGRWSLSVLTGLVVQVSTVIAEALLVVPILSATQIPLQDALSSPGLTILFGYVSNLPVCGLALWGWWRRRSRQGGAS